ncbi:MAG: AbrB/MazE/SpoVT family DNA-binding domain-containing protein [Limisphaerales bacterium]
MTTTLSSRGQIVIPLSVRERCHLKPGDHFVVEDNPETQVLTLRKVKGGGNWLEVYMECPHSLELPPRRRQMYRPKNELAR